MCQSHKHIYDHNVVFCTTTCLITTIEKNIEPENHVQGPNLSPNRLLKSAPCLVRENRFSDEELPEACRELKSSLLDCEANALSLYHTDDLSQISVIVIQVYVTVLVQKCGTDHNNENSMKACRQQLVNVGWSSTESGPDRNKPLIQRLDLKVDMTEAVRHVSKLSELEHRIFRLVSLDNGERYCSRVYRQVCG